MTQAYHKYAYADGTLHLKERTIPVPRSISAEAQQYLVSAAAMTYPQDPVRNDHVAWISYVKEAQMKPMIPVTADMLASAGAITRPFTATGMTIYEAVPERRHANARVCIYLHGGALIIGGGEVAKYLTAQWAGRYGCVTYGVDYRMPPDHPYPTPLDDCCAAYKEIVRQHAPEDIIVAGISAGGNLAAALILRLRDEGVELPAGLVLLTPELDLTESGDSFQTNRHVDVVLRDSLLGISAIYAGNHDLSHPYLSPLFGDFTRGFVPTFIQSGTRDLFLSNCVRMHRALRNAGIHSDLQLWEAMPHGGFGGSPEDTEVEREVRAFMTAV